MKYVMIKSKIALLICSFLCFSSIFLSYGESFEIPEKIKVGLRYGNNAVASVHMQSANGFRMGYMDSEERFIELYDLGAEKDVYIRKDSYYLLMDNYYYEYDFVSPRDDNRNDIIGPIHLQVGDGYNTKNQASSYAEDLKRLGLDAFIALDVNWKVWIGKYKTYSMAERDLNEIRALLGGPNMSVISYNKSRAQVVNKDGEILFIYHPGNADYCFEPKNDGLTVIDNKTFRGGFIFKNAPNNNMTVINYLSLDEYLFGVLPREMAPNSPLEALKAQAVAARSYTIKKMNNHASDHFDLCNSTHCQVYGGYSDEQSSTTRSVMETSGKVLLYLGIPIDAFYHSNSGGYTENAENIWVSVVPYLKGVKDIFSPEYLWEATYTPVELETLLKEKGLYKGSIKDIYIAEVSEYLSVQRLVIQGTMGDIVLEKDNIRSVLGYNTIKSLKFNVIKGTELYVENNVVKNGIDLGNIYILNGDGAIVRMNNSSIIYSTNGKTTQSYENVATHVYKFSGTGYGHSVGMSQAGAKKMAELGYNYKEILTHYYTDVVLTD
ncbi:MAG: SpoIID/LytB domain-containing protein [Peptostreptococcales bacterium]